MNVKNVSYISITDCLLSTEKRLCLEVKLEKKRLEKKRKKKQTYKSSIINEVVHVISFQSKKGKKSFIYLSFMLLTF